VQVKEDVSGTQKTTSTFIWSGVGGAAQGSVLSVRLTSSAILLNSNDAAVNVLGKILPTCSKFSHVYALIHQANVF